MRHLPTITSLVSALALGNQIVGAVPFLSERDNAPSSGNTVAKQAELGPMHILYQNDLSNNASTGALLLPNSVTSDSAAQICERIGEKLFPLDQSLQQGIGSDLVDQFNYLRYADTVGWSDSFWVDQGSNNVAAYKVSRGAVRSKGQGEKLGVLCTHTAPPTVVLRANPYANANVSTAGDDKRITVQAGDYTITATETVVRGVSSASPSVTPLSAPNDSCMLLPTRATRLSMPPATAMPVCSPLRPRSHACRRGLPQPQHLHSDAGLVRQEEPQARAVRHLRRCFYQCRNALHSYDGGNLAARSDVVVVATNYRLGALGYLASGKDLPGNAGISDQILALKWVKEHIAAFGGDPNRITLGGESAGAQSISALIASSEAKGLFHGAFMLSNPWVPWIKRSVQTKYITPAVATSLNCPTSGQAMVECLQKVEDPRSSCKVPLSPTPRTTSL